MREIKFRAWDKVTKIMADVTGLKTGYTDGSIGIWYINREGEENLCKPQKADIELMQYTGLKDKNGTEIYEGDTLHKEGYWDIQVEFENGSFYVRSTDKVQYANKIINVPIGYFGIEQYEVIGNIHENQSC